MNPCDQNGMRELVDSEFDQVAGGNIFGDIVDWAAQKLAEGVKSAAEAAWQPVKLPL